MDESKNKEKKSEQNKKSEQETSSEFEAERKAVESLYDDIINTLKSERENLEREVRHEYRNARRYVRANPEQGVGIAFAGGIIAGILLGKLISR